MRTREIDSQTITDFKLNDVNRTLYYDRMDKTLTLTSNDTLLIRTVGEAFDRELAKGKFQNCFGRFDSN